jgi:hypothetical protein
MKHLKAFLIVFTILIFVIPLFAQDDNSTEGFYIIDAPQGGEIADNGDDAYTITLSGVTNDVYWLVSSPEPYVGSSDLLLMTGEWASNPDDLTAHALVEMGDVVLDITITAPSYDDFFEELIVSATVNDIYSSYEDTKLEIPDSFESAVLAIIFDDAFEEGLGIGAEIMAEGARASESGRSKKSKIPKKKKK